MKEQLSLRESVNEKLISSPSNYECPETRESSLRAHKAEDLFAKFTCTSEQTSPFKLFKRFWTDHRRGSRGLLVGGGVICGV